MIQNVAISQQANHAHPCSNPFFLSDIGENGVYKSVENYGRVWRVCES